jgi:hypothetical protein
MIKRLFKRRYSVDRNWRYHNALRSCQIHGIRMGTESRINGIWVIYCLDGKLWRFRQGRVVGPSRIEDGRWREFPDKRHASISRHHK